jgi:tyrosyl-tRNA synthetase
MWNYFDLLTDLPKSEIENRRSAISKKEIHPKEVKTELAKLIMDQFHLPDKNAEAIEDWNRIHNTKNRAIPDEVETIEITEDVFLSGQTQLLQILAKQGFIPSTSEGRRLVKNGGLYLNEEKLTDEKLVLEKGKEYLIRQGKKGKFIKFLT